VEDGYKGCDSGTAGDEEHGRLGVAEVEVAVWAVDADSVAGLEVVEAVRGGNTVCCTADNQVDGVVARGVGSNGIGSPELFGMAGVCRAA